MSRVHEWMEPLLWGVERTVIPPRAYRSKQAAAAAAYRWASEHGIRIRTEEARGCLAVYRVEEAA